MRLLILSFFTLSCFCLQAQDVSIAELNLDAENAISEDSNGSDALTLKQIEAPTGQNKLIDKFLKAADKAFDKMWYSEASRHYGEALSNTKGTPAMQILQKAADSYYYIGDLENASKWYKVLYDNYENSLSEEDLFKYSDVLKGVGRKEHADRILNIIAQKDFKQATSTPSFLKYKKEALLQNLKINTKYSDFGTTFKPDGRVVFASAADTGVFKTKIYKWNDQPFLDLYEASVSEEGIELDGLKKFNKAINSKEHEASTTFTPDGKTMYFTRNNNNRKKRRKNKVNHLKILVSQLVDGKWSEPKGVSFNNKNYSTGHPALSPDGKKMYFVSDMPGGYGHTDLYVVDIDDNGNFSEPMNLGPEINSERKEMFPFITADKLYFSSDRKSGVGGLDIYQSSITDNGLTNVLNIGKPYNSNRDDFAFSLKEDEKSGFLTSNRKGGKGDDDIYYFKREKPENIIENKNHINGAVIDAITEIPLIDARITLFDANNLKVSEITSDDTGNFDLKHLISNYNYTLKVKKDGYEQLLDTLVTKDNIPFAITKKMVPVEAIAIVKNKKGASLFKTEAVYFNFDSYTIRQDAKKELDRLADYLVENNTVKLKIESHTDSRGKAAYNKYLSGKRAQASKDYLISKGVSADQIVSALGFGEEQLLNECADGASCSKQAHQLNRRSEFILVYE